MVNNREHENLSGVNDKHMIKLFNVEKIIDSEHLSAFTVYYTPSGIWLNLYLFSETLTVMLMGS